MSAIDAISVFFGSTTISLAPFSKPRLICARSACRLACILLPQIRMQAEFSNSALPAECILPILPNVYADPQSRCHWHICVVEILLGVPRAFPKRVTHKPISPNGDPAGPLQAMAIASGPKRSFISFNLSAMISNAVSQLIRSQPASGSSFGFVLRRGYFKRSS